MNTTAKTFVIAVAAVAASAAIGIGMANRNAATTETVKLDRVAVVGKSAENNVVAQLPRVVIEGRRTSLNDVTVALAQPAVRRH